MRHYCNRGLVAGKRDEYAKAVADFTAAFKIDPEFRLAYNDRALAYSATEEYAKAAADYPLAVRFAPNDYLPFSNFAWLLATCPEPNSATGNVR